MIKEDFFLFKIGKKNMFICWWAQTHRKGTYERETLQRELLEYL